MTITLWILLLATLFQLHATSGQQVPLQFESCEAGQEADPAQLLSFTNFYGQLQPSADSGSATSLKVVALGSTESQSTGFSNEVSQHIHRRDVNTYDAGQTGFLGEHRRFTPYVRKLTQDAQLPSYNRQVSFLTTCLATALLCVILYARPQEKPVLMVQANWQSVSSLLGTARIPCQPSTCASEYLIHQILPYN